MRGYRRPVSGGGHHKVTRCCDQCGFKGQGDGFYDTDGEEWRCFDCQVTMEDQDEEDEVGFR